MTTTTATLADALADLADHHWDHHKSVQYGELTLTVRIEDDDLRGSDYINDCDCYGKVAYPARSDNRYGSRPEGFTGAARKLQTDYGDTYWWEPYREGHKVYDGPEAMQIVRALMNGDGPYVVTLETERKTVCECCNREQSEDWQSTALGGIDVIGDDLAMWLAELAAELNLS